MLSSIAFVDALTVSWQTACPSEGSPQEGFMAALAPWLSTSVLEVRGSCSDECLRRVVGGGARLRSLTVRNNHSAGSLPGADGSTAPRPLSGLRELVLNNAPLVSSLDPVSSNVVAVRDPATGAVRRVVEESSLQILFVRSNRTMQELPLLMPASLLRVTLRDTVLSSLDGLARCRLLQELDVSSNRHLLDLPASLGFGEGMPYLRRVNASQTRIATVAALEECRALEVLVLDSTPCLRRLAYIPSLRELFVNYSGLSDFSAIDGHPRLEVLEAAWSKELSAAPCLPRARVLRLEGCSQLMELGMLHGNTSLRSLHIEHCRLVSALPSLPSLEVLSATCTGLTSEAIEECFAGHTCIKEVMLRGCPGIRREIPFLPTLKKIVVDDDNCV